MGKEAIKGAIREDIINFLMQALSEHYDSDVLDTSASAIVMPRVDANGNECWAKITVTIPRGTRNGTGGYDEYDGYAEHAEWEATKQERIDKENGRKEKAERAEKERERKRAARKVVKELNEKGLDAMIKEEE